MRRIFNGLVFLSLPAVVIICLAGNIRFLCVLSGSMEPSLPTGSLIGLHGTSFSALQAGDMVTYLLPDGKTQVTHRVIRKENGALYTKGDANSREDAMPVRKEQLVGKVWICIPLLGSCLMLCGRLFMSMNFGICCLALGVLLVLRAAKKYVIS